MYRSQLKICDDLLKFITKSSENVPLVKNAQKWVLESWECILCVFIFPLALANYNGLVCVLRRRTHDCWISLGSEVKDTSTPANDEWIQK